jgi:murein DD-endopeptidase MepM/ murein hydrolase activator NlpD
MSDLFHEPPVDPHDTHPTQTVPQVTAGRGRRLFALVSLLAAAGFTAATFFLLLSPSETPAPAPQVLPTEPEATQQPSPMPTSTTAQVEAAPAQDEAADEDVVPPVIAPEVAGSNLLDQPLTDRSEIVNVALIERDRLNPFTIVPDRPRDEIITYTVQQGDTINAIAERFNLEPESIAWSNPRRMIQVLRPGDVLSIPPVDGVLINTIGSSTIADYTEQYSLDDPYTVIDSPFNTLGDDVTPDTVLPSGTRLFFPGGIAEDVVWPTAIEITEGGGGSTGQTQVSTVVFQPGDPGDCGPQPITGGSMWVSPLQSSYTITRGYSGFHPGIDLAASEGVPIYAANGGKVIFSGWNSYGYGYMVALIHGLNMTVYGHMSSTAVGCGQDVSAGQLIGYMGSTGNSSGPHLHFEIRSRQGSTYVPMNPAATIGF